MIITLIENEIGEQKGQFVKTNSLVTGVLENVKSCSL